MHTFRPMVLIGMLLAGLCLLFSPRAVTATTFYIATTGSDSNPCTLAQPCRTFASGVSKLSSGGDTLYVRSGSYSTGNNFDASTMASGTSWANAIVIAAYPGEAVTLDGVGIYTHATNGSPQYVIFKDFTITGGVGCGVVVNNPNSLNHPADSYIRFQNIDCHDWTAPQSGCCGYYIFANHVEVIGGKVHDSPAGSAGSAANPCDFPGSWDCHGLYWSGAYGLVDGVEIYNNSGIGIQIYNGYFGGPTGDAHDNIIRNSRVHHNGIAPTCCSGGVDMQSGANNQAYNNLVYSNPLSLGIGGSGAGAKVYNNTTYDNGSAGIYVGTVANVEVVNNIVSEFIYDTGSGTVFVANLCVNSPTGCAVVGNPLFVNPATGDFSLQVTSPAIDQGTSLPAVSADILGISRPQGAGYDIGAYEYPSGGQSGTVQAPVNFRVLLAP